MEPGMILHLLRNPWGHSDDEVRQARLAAADELERWRRTVDHPGSAVQWIAEMQPQLTALRARVETAERAYEVTRTDMLNLTEKVMPNLRERIDLLRADRDLWMQRCIAMGWPTPEHAAAARERAERESARASGNKSAVLDQGSGDGT